MENNLDEDIKIIKDFLNNNTYKYIILDYWEGFTMKPIKELSQSMKNILSELEEKKRQIKVLGNNNRLLDISLGRELEKYKQYYEEQNEVNKKFVSKDKFDEVNAELETYKKIADNLTNTLSKEIFNKLGIKPRIEDLIEVARKEVEKDKNKN